MLRTRSRCPRTSARDDGGFSVVELTITMGILTLVVGSLLGVFISAQRSQAFVSDRSASLDELRVAMNDLTKEVRQATSISATSNASLLTMTTYIGGHEEVVTYRVVSSQLERVDGSGNVRVVATRIASTAVFSYSPLPQTSQVIKVTLQTNPRRSPDTTLELSSEIRLRNRGQGL